MTLRTSAGLQDITRFLRCSEISHGAVTSRTRQSHGRGSSSQKESALILKDSTQQSTLMMMKRSMRGGNSSLRAKFTALGRMIIIGSWVIQGLAGHAVKYITIAAKNIHAVNPHAESAVIVIDTWRYGISYSLSLTAKKTAHYPSSHIRTLIRAWD